MKNKNYSFLGFAAVPSVLVLLSIPGLAMVGGCAGSSPRTDVWRNLASAPVEELPWEVIADNGDMVLPDLFYSENSQNEQIMSLKIHGRYQIDHVVYPTLGNPKLFVRDNPRDSMMAVLRLEHAYLDPFHPTPGAQVPGRNFSYLTLAKADKDNGLFFYLVPHDKRMEKKDMGMETTDITAGTQESIANLPGVIQIRPTYLAIQPQAAAMPERFKNRETIRAVFGKDAMAGVPAGLYDLRFEPKVGGRLMTDGKSPVYDFEYNSVQVFDHGPGSGGAYTVLNFSDSQINAGWIYRKYAIDHIEELVKYLNTTTNPQVQEAAFITFNGDLHNGGSVLQRYPRSVATEYNIEATMILDLLKQLKKPVFLTAGNHDGYVSTGQVPAAVDQATRNQAVSLYKKAANAILETTAVTDARDELAKLAGKFKLTAGLVGFLEADPRGLDTIEEVIQSQPARDINWPDFTIDKFHRYLKATDQQKLDGGWHRDLFQGQYVRYVGKTFGSWVPVPEAQRNMILYDGQQQWRKAYGPLYYTYSFGDNYFISLNSFELRQHWRAGWGMYTVNYGGGLSEVQTDWLARELERNRDRDVTLYAHHDPRGGHEGHDYPFYFHNIDYGGATAADLETDTPVINQVRAAIGKLYGGGVADSSVNYLMSEVLEPKVCEKISSQFTTEEQQLGCMHDGLQEWMTRDSQFDCDDVIKLKNGGTCPAQGAPSWYSGYALLNLIATSPNIRTMVLGHTHFNSVDELQAGDALVKKQVVMDKATMEHLKLLDVTGNPIRDRLHQGVTDSVLKQAQDGSYRGMLDISKVFSFQNVLQGSHRELAILRVTTAADLTSQTVSGDKNKQMYGFQAFTFFSNPHDSRGYEPSQLNRVNYYRNLIDGKNDFGQVYQLNLDRTRELRSANGNNDPADAKYVGENPLATEGQMSFAK